MTRSAIAGLSGALAGLLVAVGAATGSLVDFEQPPDGPLLAGAILSGMALIAGAAGGWRLTRSPLPAPGVFLGAAAIAAVFALVILFIFYGVECQKYGNCLLN